MALVWTHLVGLNASLWGDEVNTVVQFIAKGPSGIFDARNYSANNHMLFSILTWVTTQITAQHGEWAYRVWAVGPAIGASALITWWAWRRFGRWAAAAVALVVTEAPQLLAIAIEARGYGLSIFASALLLVAADGVLRARSRRGFVVFGVAGVIGIFALPSFVVPFIGMSVVLFAVPGLRRPTLLAVAAVGAASVAFYAPVITGMLKHADLPPGALLPWYGFITGPLRDQVAPSVSLVLPQLPQTADTLVAAALVAAGVLGLWRRGERMPAIAALVPAMLSYLFFEVTGLVVLQRYGSIVQMPMLFLAAMGLVTLGLGLARTRLLAAATLTATCLVAVIALAKIADLGAHYADFPKDNFKQAAAIVRARGIAQVVTSIRDSLGFDYYLPGRFTRMNAAGLQSVFCSNASPLLAYIENGLAGPTDTTCLRRRGATRIAVADGRSTLAVWIVAPSAVPLPPPASGAGAAARVVVIPPLGLARPQAKAAQASPDECFPYLDTSVLPGAGTAAFGSSMVERLAPRASFSIRPTLAFVLGSIAGRFLGGKRVIAAHPPAELVGVEYAVQNLGTLAILPRSVNAGIGIRLDNEVWRSTDWQTTRACGSASTALTFDRRVTFASQRVAPGQTATSIAVFALPAPLRNLALVLIPTGDQVRLPDPTRPGAAAAPARPRRASKPAKR